jgi:Cu/Ag efflux pump CusA
VRGRNLGGTVAEAQARIAKDVKLPNGYRIKWAGEFEDLRKAQNCRHSNATAVRRPERRSSRRAANAS